MRKPSPSLVIALLALFVALGGPAQAAKLISGSKIKKNTITSKQIKNRTITSGDISSTTLSSLKAKANNVTSTQIVDGSVTLSDLAAGSVTGNQVVDRSLTGIDLALDSVSAGELATSSVDNAELAANSVTGNKIRTGAVTKGKIGSSDVGTEEIIDRSLTGVDIAKASGKITTTFTNIGAGTCAPAQSFDSPAYSIPATGIAGAVVLANAPADNVSVTARAVDDNTISLQACNDTSTAIGSVSGDFPYIAIAP